MVVTQFVPSSAAAPGEAGELVYYRPQDPPPSPTIAAAGDISCQNTACHDDETSELLVQDAPTKVLTLGDNQYEHGELVNFEKYYHSDWGRVKAITMPTPGNHDPPSSGYGPYFGKPPNYSFDLGAWHLIALDSTGIAAATRVPRLRSGPVRGAALHPRLLAPPALLVGRHARQQCRDRAALDPAGGGRSRCDPERPRSHL